MQRSVHPVPDNVRLSVRQRAGVVLQDEAHEEVLLPREDPETLPRPGREELAASAGPHLDVREEPRIVARTQLDEVTNLLLVQTGREGDRDVTPDRRSETDSPVRGEIPHLSGDERVRRTQETDVLNALGKHHEAVQAHAERKTRGAGEPRELEDGTSSEAALTNLEPLRSDEDVDLETPRRVRVRRLHETDRRTREDRLDDGAPGPTL